jgi:hypothetical protein
MQNTVLSHILALLKTFTCNEIQASIAQAYGEVANVQTELANLKQGIWDCWVGYRPGTVKETLEGTG